MSIKFNNQLIRDAVQRDSRSKTVPYNISAPEIIGMDMLWGYTSSLIDISNDKKVNKELDLTYSTVKNLMDVIAIEFGSGFNADPSVERNLSIAEKTVAAYLYLLAINNEKNQLIFTSDKVDPDNYPARNQWTGVNIKLQGGIAQYDLLKAMQGKVEFNNDVLTVYVEDVSNLYLQATGVNLKDYGLDDIEMSFVK